MILCTEYKKIHKTIHKILWMVFLFLKIEYKTSGQINFREKLARKNAAFSKFLLAFFASGFYNEHTKWGKVEQSVMKSHALKAGTHKLLRKATEVKSHDR